MDNKSKSKLIKSAGESLRSKVIRGDYIQVSKMMTAKKGFLITVANARMRCYRDNEEALEMLKEVIESREGLVHKYLKQEANV